jgi:2-polyprenyl-6-methoxyphenol hydroxylase-like FAD-dependent oxidoreductase
VLVGDAAHVHSPAGGQGMNTGLVDACVLASMLTEVISGGAADDYLDRYEHQRRPAAASVLKLAGRLTRMATLRSPVARYARNQLLGLIGVAPAISRQLKLNLSGLSRRTAAAPYGAVE